MHFLLTLFAGILGAAGSLSMRAFQTNFQKTQLDLRLYQTCYMCLAAFLYLIVSGFSLPTTPTAWLLAFCFSLCLSVSAYCAAEYMLCGPLSLGSIIVSCNVILPIFVGCIFYREKLTVLQIVGFLLLLLTFFFASYRTSANEQKISLKWYILVFLCFLANGCGSLCLNGYAKIATSGNDSFLAASYMLAAVTLLAYYLILSLTRHDKSCIPLRPSFMILLLISGFSCGAVNFLLLYLNRHINASVLYPLYNSMSAVTISISSCLVFREALTKQKTCAIITGICAIVLLNI